jgi:hypothetical protein
MKFNLMFLTKIDNLFQIQIRLKEIIEFKEFIDAETLIYFDTRTEEIIEI